MPARSIYLVFILPAALSLVLGGAVVGAVLQEPGRSLDMTGAGGGGKAPLESDQVAILGLSSSYGVSEMIAVEVAALADSFDCGDLYVTITRAGTDEVVYHDGYFGQCYAAAGATLPVDETYTKSLDVPGSYEIRVDLTDARGGGTASVRSAFTVQ